MACERYNVNSSDSFSDDNHSRTIIHIDLDCFYAQVEMLKNPELRKIPLAVSQKHIIVTSNHIAREFGIKKCMSINECLQLCPHLKLVNGEDLHDYRKMSTKVTEIVKKYATLIERLGFDENFLDVTELVKTRMKSNVQPVGNIYGSTEQDCECGCYTRLNIGSVIASEIRNDIKTELGLTSCAGIAHNKLLAKLGGATHRPDQQTIVYPSNASQLMFSLPNIKSIPGIGQNTFEIFKSLNIKTVEELRYCPFEKLEKTFGKEKANIYLGISYGKDNSPVKISGKPQTIGIEDACRTVRVEAEAKEKFRLLLHRLMILVSEDGRTPQTLKITVRKFDAQRKTSLREQRQCNVSPTLFNVNNSVQLSPQAEEKLMTTIMQLFYKLVDISKPFRITLIGLAFTKFQERKQGKNSIASFLMKNLSVQSVTTLENKNDNSGSSQSTMEHSSVSQKSLECNTDGSESEFEPSPKKTKFDKLIAKRRCLDPSVDCPSPSKLRVGDLRLNSREFDRSPSENTEKCPDNVDPDVFKELPLDVQQELIQQWKIDQKARMPVLKKPKTNTLLTYLIKNK